MLNSRKIEDLLPSAQDLCQEHIAACKAGGDDVLLIQTRRDAAYQQELYHVGRRGIPGEATVTDCDGLKKLSRHQSGKAWDLVPLDKHGNADWKNDAAFERMAKAAERLGIRAGRRFKRVDSPHFEIP